MNRRTVAAALTASALASLVLAAPTQAAPGRAPVDRTAAVTASNDWDGDGRSDLAALSRDGRIYVYRGTGAGFSSTRQLVVSGLRGFISARIAGDVDDNGVVDILGRNDRGQLWVFRGGPAGSYAGAVQVPGDWSGLEEVLPMDVDVDGVVDLLGLDDEADHGGGIYLYRGGAGVTFRRSTYVPLGAQSFGELSAWGDADHDGYQELVLLDLESGLLRALETHGSTSLFQSNDQHRVVGTGWGAFTAIVSTGDFSGDGNPDVLARTAAGELRLYRADDQGRLGRPTTVGTGWGSLRFG